MRSLWLFPLALLSCASDCGHTTSFHVVEATALAANEDGVFVRLEKSKVDDHGWGGIDTKTEDTQEFRVTASGLERSTSTWPTPAAHWSGRTLVSRAGVTLWSAPLDDCSGGVHQIASPDARRYATVLACPNDTTRFVEVGLDGQILANERVPRPIQAFAALANDGALASADSNAAGPAWSWLPGGQVVDLPVGGLTAAIGSSWLQSIPVATSGQSGQSEQLSVVRRDGTSFAAPVRTVRPLGTKAPHVLAAHDRLFVLQDETNGGLPIEDSVQARQRLVQIGPDGAVLREDALTF